jgi:hypothetical protein
MKPLYHILDEFFYNSILIVFVCSVEHEDYLRNDIRYFIRMLEPLEKVKETFGVSLTIEPIIYQ